MPGEIIIGLVLLALGAILALRFDLLPEDRLRAWKAAAESCGLQVTSGSGRSLEAGAGGLTVRIETEGGKGQFIRIVLGIPGSTDFQAVRIRLEPLLPPGPEIQVGDAPFDRTFFVEGPAPQVFALLDEETRRLLLLLRAVETLDLSSGRLSVSISEGSLLLPRLVDLGRRLAQPLDVPRRLVENAKRDPVPEVRLRNLLLLVREFPGELGAAEALRAASADPVAEIRLQAAKELGAEGRDVLFDLAESLADDRVSAEAVSALDRELPFERAKALLDRALSQPAFWTARACLAAIGKSGDAAAVETLAKVMDQQEGELAAAAAETLGAMENPAAEPPLILALRRELPDLQKAVVNALGRTGSVAAVLPLREAAGRSWFDLDLRRATRQAIAEIQSRLPGATPGQLSLTETEAGQLSLAADPAGQISLSDLEEERS